MTKTIAVGLACLAAMHGPAVARPYHAKRTPDGRPDLQGFWTNGSLTPLEREPGTPLTFPTHAEEIAYEQRLSKIQATADNSGVGQGLSEWRVAFPMARIAGRLRTSWVVSPADGRLPYRPEALRRFKALVAAAQQAIGDDPEARPAMERCLMAAGGSATPPMLNPAQAPAKQIVQTPAEVAILSEMNHDVRIVRIGGRHLPASVHVWMGDSIGHWEHDTLVVETTNFHPQEEFRRGMLLSPQGRVTERFTRVSAGELLYEFEVDDPANYTATWRAQMPLIADTGPIYEFACHEGNYSLANILAAARRGDAEPAAPIKP